MRLLFAATLIAGVLLRTYQAGYFANQPEPWLLLLFLWPYAIASAFLYRATSWAPAAAGMTVALTIDLWTHYLVFFTPGSSTSAVALFFSAIYGIFLVPVAGFFVRYVTRKENSDNQAG